jgi:hypothetical protein
LLVPPPELEASELLPPEVLDAPDPVELPLAPDEPPLAPDEVPPDDCAMADVAKPSDRIETARIFVSIELSSIG